jgi:hypothetical protein
MTSRLHVLSHGRNKELAGTLRRLADDLARIEEDGFLASIAPDATLLNWRLAARDAVCLVGEVEGHPLLADGPIVTSEVYYVNLDVGVARTLSHWYLLNGISDMTRSPLSRRSAGERSRR